MKAATQSALSSTSDLACSRRGSPVGSGGNASKRTVDPLPTADEREAGARTMVRSDSWSAGRTKVTVRSPVRANTPAKATAAGLASWSVSKKGESTQADRGTDPDHTCGNPESNSRPGPLTTTASRGAPRGGPARSPNP